MTDTLSKRERSARMGLVKSRDTKPELVVRRLTFRLGYRYRLHMKSLPGCPDLVFTARRKVILVHGCFWHRHPNCRRASTPVTNSQYWARKFTSNVDRDGRTRSHLLELGWKVLIVWECEIRNESNLRRRVLGFLSRAHP